MKKLLLLLSLSIFFQSAFGRVLTVSNTATDVAQYSILQKAFDDAKVDDTVYVHGSPNSYGAGVIRRRMVVIGAGYAPNQTQFQFSTDIQTLDLDSTVTGGFGGVGEPINGVKLYSLNIGTFNSNNAVKENNVTIERCKFSSYLYVTGFNWTIVNNWINILNIQNHNNIVVANNFIKHAGNSNQPSVIFSNNIFIPNGNGVGSITSPVGAITYAIFTNNIFINSKPTAGISFSTFNSNIIGNIDFLQPIATMNNNTGGNNIENTDPLFVTFPKPAPTSLSDIAPYNFKLDTQSQGKGKGTDGKDIGIYGGTYPLQEMGGASTLPQITRMDISNSVLPKTDKLKVSFKARKVN